MAEPGGNIVDATGLTIKEYLARIDAKVDKIDEKLDSKADVALVSSLDARLRSLEVGVSQATGIAAEVAQLKVEHGVALDKLYADINWLKKKVWLAAGATGTLAAIWSLLHEGIIKFS